jgi:cytochrome c oxidase subunit 2
LAGVFGSQVFLADGKTIKADDAYIRESIVNPQAKLVAGFGPIMPTFQGQVSEEQLLQILAFIKSLQMVNREPAAPVQSPTVAPQRRAPASPVTQPR